MLNELKIKICSLGLKVKCNLLGMSGGGKKGSERLSITLHRPILGRHKSKRRLRKIPRTQVLSGLTTVLPLQSVQLIPPRGWCTVCISSPSYSSHYTRLLYLQTLQNIFFFFMWIQWNWLLFASCQFLTGERLSKVRQAHSIYFIIGYQSSWEEQSLLGTIISGIQSNLFKH